MRKKIKKDEKLFPGEELERQQQVQEVHSGYLTQLKRTIPFDRWDLLVLLLFFLVAFGMNWPLFSQLGSRLPHDYDPVLQSWILAWDCHQLLGGAGGFFDARYG